MSAALNKVLDGGIYLPEHIISSNMKDVDLLGTEIALEHLTKRQLEILKCLAGGMSNKEVAKKLFISENTVKTHVKALLSELGCKNRTEAGVLAEKYGLTTE